MRNCEEEIAKEIHKEFQRNGKEEEIQKKKN